MSIQIESDLKEVLDKFDQKLDKLDTKIDKLDDKFTRKLDDLSKDVTDLKVDVARIKTKVDGWEIRINSVEFLNRDCFNWVIGGYWRWIIKIVWFFTPNKSIKINPVRAFVQTPLRLLYLLLIPLFGCIGNGLFYSLFS